MAIPFEGQTGSSSGSGSGSGGGCGDGRDGRRGNDDRRSIDNRKPIDDEERIDQEANIDDMDNLPELLGAHGGGDVNPIQGQDEEDSFPTLPMPEIPEEEAEDAREAAALYMNFLHEELRNNGVGNDEFLDLVPENVEPVLPEWIDAGEDLRRVARQLEDSPDREWIRRRAAAVDLDELDFENFSLLLAGLFEGGITITRIVVLFAFCSDLVLRAWNRGAKSKLQMLIEWSMKYIVTNISHWVHNHGGWATVVRRVQENRVSWYAATVVAVCACVFFVTKN